MVEADIVGFTSNRTSGRRGKTIGADLDDDEDDDDELTMGTMTPFSPMSQTQIAASALTDVDLGPAAIKIRDNEYKIKYGQPGLVGLNGGWSPIQVSQRQQNWLHRALALIASFMAASLVYTLVFQLPQVQHKQPIPPNPWFIAILAGIAPLATVGALLVNRSHPWTLRDTIDRACTGTASAFIVLTLFRVLWQVLLNSKQPMLQLVVLLLVTAIGASLGTTVTISEYINYSMSWAMAKAYWATIIGITVLGGILGFLLTLGLASLWGTIIAILVGAGIGSALIWRVDHLMKQNATDAQNNP